MWIHFPKSNIDVTTLVCFNQTKKKVFPLHPVNSAVPFLLSRLRFLRARGARLDPCDTDCRGCLLQPPECWPYSRLPRTEPGYGGESWWPWRPSGPARPTAGSPCSLAARLGTGEWTCPPGSFCATRWSHHEGRPSRFHPPMRERKSGGHFQETDSFFKKYTRSRI